MMDADSCIAEEPLPLARSTGSIVSGSKVENSCLIFLPHGPEMSAAG